MEEVDNIIIDSLRNIHCTIDDEIQSLKEFSPELVFTSVVCCVESILPNVKFAHTLPPSMSLRLKLATNIAETIKELGYRGDMGYQTILYCNEVEVRRVLMFLVERLPRDTSKTTVTEDLSYVSRLMKNIEEHVKLSLEKPWVPTGLLKNGLRDCGKVHLRQSFAYSWPLQTESLDMPFKLENSSEASKYYQVHHLPDVTRQCSNPRNLIPSLLFRDSEFSTSQLNFKEVLSSTEILELSLTNGQVDHVDNFIKNLEEIPNTEIQENQTEKHLEMLIQEVANGKSKYKELQYKHKKLELKLSQMTEEMDKKEIALKESITKMKTRSKALTVLSNEENIVKLKALVENGTKRLIELANQWNQVQAPLLEQYQEMRLNLNVHKSKILNEQQKLQNVKEKNQQLATELQEKDKLEQQLKQEYEKLNKNTHRSAYTRRILEIIGNIKKQNEEIEKVLNLTKDVQKDINNLNGQLDRSFTLSDELIFRDAKRDEMARKAYKLLATLHTDCNEVIQSVTDLGLVERESRNLEEQVDAELAREMSVKFEKVNADLTEVRKETALLMKQIKDKM